jgi:cytosine deaminase
VYLLRNARLPGRDGASDIEIDGGRIARIVPAGQGSGETFLDAAGSLVTPPFVEPHVHLDTTLTAGEPRWNASGSLWEGIAVWSERKRTLTREDVIARASEVLRWYAANGVLHVRSHVDVTDPGLVALDAMLEVRERVSDVMTLQLVAFPQEGIVSFDDGAGLLEEAARRGVDVIGAIPHFEDTREDGVRSLEIAFGIAERHGLLLDAHCDEIDDEQSRFVEVLATLARRSGLRDRATASHTTAMGSYNGAYSYKLQRILARSGINLVCNPIANLCLQGRFDAYPRRRGLTQVKEMLSAGVNVAFGHDDVMDPWSPLGTASSLQVALIGIVGAQLTGRAEMDEAFAMITERPARVLRLGDGYGIGEGRPADLVVLPAASPYDAVRRQTRPTHVISKGRIIAETPATPTRLSWPGQDPRDIDFTRPGDRPVT